MPVSTLTGMPCDFCGEEFDPIATRWLCPHCHQKANCCSGAPLPFSDETWTPLDVRASTPAVTS